MPKSRPFPCLGLAAAIAAALVVVVVAEPMDARGQVSPDVLEGMGSAPTPVPANVRTPPQASPVEEVPAQAVLRAQAQVRRSTRRDLEAGATCDVQVARFPASTPSGYLCRADVRCGNLVLYGAGQAGVFACSWGAGDRPVVEGNDARPAQQDGDPMFAVSTRSRTVVVEDRSGTAELYLATVQVERPTYAVRVVSAVVSDRTADGRCWDDGCSLPDLYAVIRSGSRNVTTTRYDDSARASWPASAPALPAQEGQFILVALYDYDRGLLNGSDRILEARIRVTRELIAEGGVTLSSSDGVGTITIAVERLR